MRNQRKIKLTYNGLGTPDIFQILHRSIYFVRGTNIEGQRRAMNRKKSLSSAFDKKGIKKLPKGVGVYALGCDKKTYYVGQSKNVQRRVAEHLRNGEDACRVKVIPTASVAAAKRLEKQMVAKHCPPNNKLLKTRCEKGFFERLFS